MTYRVLQRLGLQADSMELIVNTLQLEKKKEHCEIFTMRKLLFDVTYRTVGRQVQSVKRCQRVTHVCKSKQSERTLTALPK